MVTIKRIALVMTVIVFLGGSAFVGSKLYKNIQKVELEPAQSQKPTLPTISFIMNDYEVNELLAYRREMDISAAREYLTPLDAQGNIHLNINDYGNEIQSISYAVYTLDGNTMLCGETLVADDNKISLNLNTATTDVIESVLNIKMTVNDEEINYYTRIIGYDQLMMGENLSFVEDFHDATLDVNHWDYLDEIVDSVVENSEINLGNVSLDSSISDIQWGGLEVEVLGDVKWRISESSSIYTGVELSYVVGVKTDENIDYFFVEEYFRTSYNQTLEGVQLNDYRRIAEQIYKPEEEDVEYKKIKLAVNSQDLHIIESEDENVIVFTQGKELFSFNSTENRLTKIYGNNSWLESQELDSREMISQYDVRALDVDEEGNTSFIVYGYVNSGENEGLVGTSIYYYYAEECITIEKAFICGDKSYAQSKEELAENTYYSTENQEIYIYINQVIYAINLETMDKRQISQRLHYGEYVFSEGSQYIAFNNGEGDILSSLTVLSIVNGEEYDINAKEGENIYPLGFVGTDLVIGYASKDDLKSNYRGEEITPSYEVEVRNESNEVVKTYSKENYFIEDVTIEDRVLYLNQLIVEGGVYSMADSEYIANNVVVKESSIVQVTGSGERLGVVKYVALKNASTKEWEYKQAVEMKDENKIIIAYETNNDEQIYQVYAYGKLYKNCKDLAEAINLADGHYGYVLNSNQGYVWRRGARSLNYTAISQEDQVKTRLKDGMTALELVKSYAGDSIQNYTGLSLESLCYLINQDQILAVEFNTGSWGVVTGYTIDTLYYLDENGTKRSGEISRLNGLIQTIIGDSNLY